MVSLKNVFSNIPVGLVNARNPLGHSGQRRLQEVVGSKEIETGYPH
jgi:spore maturation protein SpmA